MNCKIRFTIANILLTLLLACAAASAQAPPAPILLPISPAAAMHSVTLTWTASPQVGAAGSGYNVYSSSNTGGPYAKKNTVLATALLFTDTNVAPAQTLFYVVTAVVGTQESVFSNEVSALVPSDTPPPPPPVVHVAIAPLAPTVQGGKTIQFSATVTGSTNTGVLWTASAGTVTSSGLFTAPMPAGTTTVTATSAADSTASASTSVSVTAPPPPPTPPPPPGLPKVGDRVKIGNAANVRETAVAGAGPWGTVRGIAVAGALATVVEAPTVQATTFFWVKVKLDACVTTIPNCTGYVGSDNLTPVVAPPPPPPAKTLKITCVLNVCTLQGMNIPAGTAFTVTATSSGVSATATGTLP